MSKSLQSRKQEFVRNAIYESAIQLFAKKGFEETTVEEIAQAAGVSRRSFFRYYPGKDDLLAHSIVSYGQVLVSAVKTSTANSLMEVIRETVLAGAKHSATQALTRQAIEISIRSPAAMRAHHSRLWDVENKLAEEFARRLGTASKFDMRARLLAGLTLTTINSTVLTWFKQERQDIVAASKQVFETLDSIVCKNGKLSQIANRNTVREKRSPNKE